MHDALVVLSLAQEPEEAGTTALAVRAAESIKQQQAALGKGRLPPSSPKVALAKVRHHPDSLWSLKPTCTLPLLLFWC